MRLKRQPSSANEADSFVSFRGTRSKLVSATAPALSRLSAFSYVSSNLEFEGAAGSSSRTHCGRNTCTRPLSVNTCCPKGSVTDTVSCVWVSIM